MTVKRFSNGAYTLEILSDGLHYEAKFGLDMLTPDKAPHHWIVKHTINIKSKTPVGAAYITEEFLLFTTGEIPPYVRCIGFDKSNTYKR